MKIVCKVDVVNRALPTLCLPNKKGARSSLTLGKSPDKDIFVLHQTIQNACGTKYKVKDNILNVFTKFVNEGKATIRFKKPEHDLAIQCDPIQLKGFLKTLKLCLDGKTPSLKLSTISRDSVQKKKLNPVKTKLAISSPEDYPVLEGFPRTLESLVINGVNQKTLDTRILQLRSLRLLNVENNQLRTLPEALGSSLPNLTELYLSENNLGEDREWRWIVNSELQNQLKLLDLSYNNIDILPHNLVKLGSLVTLKVDGNKLGALPNAIGFMRSLRYFSASDNQIRFLPGSILHLNLQSIDLSGNCDIMTQQEIVALTPADFRVVPSLVDLSAYSVLNHKLHYTEETLPLTLIELLEKVSFCVCGKPCFTSQPVSYVPYTNNSAWLSVISSHNGVHMVAVRFCSLQCYRLKRMSQEHRCVNAHFDHMYVRV